MPFKHIPEAPDVPLVKGPNSSPTPVPDCCVILGTSVFSSIKWESSWFGEGMGGGDEDLMGVVSPLGLTEAGGRWGQGQGSGREPRTPGGAPEPRAGR